MKKLILCFISLIYSLTSQAESISAAPFKITFYKTQDYLDLEIKLHLVCRNEKWVISDSAEFEYKTKEIPLTKSLSFSDRENLTRVTFTSSLSHRLVLSGVFKPTKECRPEFSINFVDQKHLFSKNGKKNISFIHFSNARFESGDTVLNPDILFHDFIERTFSFAYIPYSTQVNVELFADNERLNVRGVEKNPETNMPFEK